MTPEDYVAIPTNSSENPQNSIINDSETPILELEPKMSILADRNNNSSGDLISINQSTTEDYSPKLKQIDKAINLYDQDGDEFSDNEDLEWYTYGRNYKEIDFPYIINKVLQNGEPKSEKNKLISKISVSLDKTDEKNFIEHIYRENQKKAATVGIKSTQEFLKKSNFFPVRTILEPSDWWFWNQQIEKHEKILPFLMDWISARNMKLHEKEVSLLKKFKQLYKKWRKRVEALELKKDVLQKEIQNRSSPEYVKRRGLAVRSSPNPAGTSSFSKSNPQLDGKHLFKNDRSHYSRDLQLMELWDTELEEVRYSTKHKAGWISKGDDQFTSDAVRSDAELQEIIQRLQYDEVRNPESRSQRTAAVIPNMIMDPAEILEFKLKASNVKIPNPVEYYSTNLNTNFKPGYKNLSMTWASDANINFDGPILNNNCDPDNIWTSEECSTFVREFLRSPKKFGHISESLEYKTTKDCVLFYYRNKKPLDIKSLLARHKRKSRRNRKNTSPSITMDSIRKRKDRLKDRANETVVNGKNEKEPGLPIEDNRRSESITSYKDEGNQFKRVVSNSSVDNFGSSRRGRGSQKQNSKEKVLESKSVYKYKEEWTKVSIDDEENYIDQYSEFDSFENNLIKSTSTNLELSKVHSRSSLYEKSYHETDKQDLTNIYNYQDYTDTRVEDVYKSKYDPSEISKKYAQSEKESGEISEPDSDQFGSEGRIILDSTMLLSGSVNPITKYKNAIDEMNNSKKQFKLKDKTHMLGSDASSAEYEDEDRDSNSDTKSDTQSASDWRTFSDDEIAFEDSMDRLIFCGPPCQTGADNAILPPIPITTARPLGNKVEKLRAVDKIQRLPRVLSFNKIDSSLDAGENGDVRLGAVVWNYEERVKALDGFYRFNRNFAEITRLPSGQMLSEMIEPTQQATLPVGNDIFKRPLIAPLLPNAGSAFTSAFEQNSIVDNSPADISVHILHKSATTPNVPYNTFIQQPKPIGLALPNPSFSSNNLVKLELPSSSIKTTSVNMTNTETVDGQYQQSLLQNAEFSTEDAIQTQDNKPDQRKRSGSIKQRPGKAKIPKLSSVQMGSNTMDSDQNTGNLASFGKNVDGNYSNEGMNVDEIVGGNVIKKKGERKQGKNKIIKSLEPHIPYSDEEGHSSEPLAFRLATFSTDTTLNQRTSIPIDDKTMLPDKVHNLPVTPIGSFNEQKVQGLIPPDNIQTEANVQKIGIASQNVIQGDEETKISTPMSKPQGGEIPPVSEDKQFKKPAYSSYWSVQERNSFTGYLLSLGPNWTEIANVMNTKTATQVRNYYRTNKDKLGFEALVAQYEERKAAGLPPLPIDEQILRQSKANDIGSERRGRKKKTSFAQKADIQVNVGPITGSASVQPYAGNVQPKNGVLMSPNIEPRVQNSPFVNDITYNKQLENPTSGKSMPAQNLIPSLAISGGHAFVYNPHTQGSEAPVSLPNNERRYSGASVGGESVASYPSNNQYYTNPPINPQVVGYQQPIMEVAHPRVPIQGNYNQGHEHQRVDQGQSLNLDQVAQISVSRLQSSQNVQPVPTNQNFTQSPNSAFSRRYSGSPAMGVSGGMGTPRSSIVGERSSGFIKNHPISTERSRASGLDEGSRYSVEQGYGGAAIESISHSLKRYDSRASESLSSQPTPPPLENVSRYSGSPPGSPYYKPVRNEPVTNIRSLLNQAEGLLNVSSVRNEEKVEYVDQNESYRRKYASESASRSTYWNSAEPEKYNEGDVTVEGNGEQYEGYGEQRSSVQSGTQFEKPSGFNSTKQRHTSASSNRGFIGLDSLVEAATREAVLNEQMQSRGIEQENTTPKVSEPNTGCTEPRNFEDEKVYMDQRYDYKRFPYIKNSPYEGYAGFDRPGVGEVNEGSDNGRGKSRSSNSTPYTQQTPNMYMREERPGGLDKPYGRFEEMKGKEGMEIVYEGEMGKKGGEDNGGKFRIINEGIQGTEGVMYGVGKENVVYGKQEDVGIRIGEKEIKGPNVGPSNKKTMRKSLKFIHNEASQIAGMQKGGVRQGYSGRNIMQTRVESGHTSAQERSRSGSIGLGNTGGSVAPVYVYQMGPMGQQPGQGVYNERPQSNVAYHRYNYGGESGVVGNSGQVAHNYQYQQSGYGQHPGTYGYDQSGGMVNRDGYVGGGMVSREGPVVEERVRQHSVSYSEPRGGGNIGGGYHSSMGPGQQIYQYIPAQQQQHSGGYGYMSSQPQVQYEGSNTRVYSNGGMIGGGYGNSMIGPGSPGAQKEQSGQDKYTGSRAPGQQMYIQPYPHQQNKHDPRLDYYETDENQRIQPKTNQPRKE
ncbi:hypothetical protein BB559_005655 [Furculomyces boomerangus]|uniref:SANT domain-containing protein n=1 Tax=Furculomyces boomerangus TaxID=61424 RepID=A0A2T9Y7G3_9FUNG|nr:hypothetical protein BB559_005655 [Furculomyces boomerangus]